MASHERATETISQHGVTLAATWSNRLIDSEVERKQEERGVCGCLARTLLGALLYEASADGKQQYSFLVL